MGEFNQRSDTVLPVRPLVGSPVSISVVGKIIFRPKMNSYMAYPERTAFGMT